MERPDFYHYLALFDYEDDGVHVTFPDLPGCITKGANEEEAIRAARNVLSLHLWGMEEDKEILPKPSSSRELIGKKNYKITKPSSL
jgi:predicted RNase H-like HicB family nuclease